MKLILASASPRRRELLEKTGLPFEVIVSACDETLPAGTPAHRAAELLSIRKAEAVAKEHPDATVIGADTTVLCDDRVLGKPADRADCIRMMHMLSGRTHLVQTGCTILSGAQRVSFTAETEVTFYPLTDAEIEAYATAMSPMTRRAATASRGRAGC